MTGLNSTWDDLINQSDGRFLTNTEVKVMQQYLHTLPTRLKIYELLRDKSEALIKQALKKFMLVHPEVMNKHSKRCIYDMTNTVCIMSLSILKDDERFFQEMLMLWLANILTAYQQNVACYKAYSYLQELFQQNLPGAASQLTQPYMELVLQSLEAPPKLMATVQRPGAF